MTGLTEFRRAAPIDLDAEAFLAAGHELVDRIGGFLADLPGRPVAPDVSPSDVRERLGNGSLPTHGDDPARLLREASELLFEYSTFNGHPRFWGYVTASAAPIGILADVLAAAVNPNVGGWALSPMATEIEAQTIRWIAELIGYPATCGGLMVSGGNMANLVGMATARRAKLPWDVRKVGLGVGGRRPRLYATNETHTWLQKAADLLGLGTDAIRWIPTDDGHRMDITELRLRIQADAEAGDLPFLVIGNAGTVSTGAVDPLPELAALCRERGIWFHVDGAYGGLAAMLSYAPDDLRGISEADSVAIDPHKWLYAPLEAGYALVRESSVLRDAFSYHPPYYHFDDLEDPPINYYEYGPQNSRGFRALKVWLALRQVGRSGYERMIADDIHLAQALAGYVRDHPNLKLRTQGLSITTFRYVPAGLATGLGPVESYLNDLNEALLAELQHSGELFVSNAVLDGVFVLRACIVNFRTSLADVAALPEIVARHGAALDARLRPAHLEFS